MTHTPLTQDEIAELDKLCEAREEILASYERLALYTIDRDVAGDPEARKATEGCRGGIEIATELLAALPRLLAEVKKA
ncbi:hypothetical protein LCGC14_1656390, partial [marine sediment metagenome]